jgi:hypothetical protein
MIVNNAKYISRNENIEEEINLEIEGVRISGFTMGVPYKLKVGAVYPVNLELTIFDDEIEELHATKYGVENIGGGFAHHLYGKLDKDILRLGSFEIQDEQLLRFSKFDGKFIHLIVNRIMVELL